MNNLAAEVKNVEVGESSIGSKLQSLKNNAILIHQVMAEVLKENEHYGTIPGTNKPTLLKSGAEKISMVFRFFPAYDVQVNHLDNGHREYMIKCSLANQNGEIIGMGVGICSTMESKYRYRNDRVSEYVGEIPKDYRENKDKYRKQYLSAQKDESGTWGFYKTIVTKKENPDIADTYNTVLKMAKKRAYVDAVITATGCSDMFTQDVEDFIEEPPIMEVKKEQEQPKPKQEIKEANPPETASRSTDEDDQVIGEATKEETSAFFKDKKKFKEESGTEINKIGDKYFVTGIGYYNKHLAGKK